MKKICFITLYFIFVSILITYNVFAEERKNHFGGSLGGEVWYAYWKSEGGLEKQGIELDYDIKPSFVYGYSASINYYKADQLYTGLILDYFTSKMEREISDQAFEGNGDNLETYQMIKSKFDQRIGENGYFHLQLMSASFEGELILKAGSEALNLPSGSSWDLNAKWFKADAMYLFDMGDILPGVGFRYIEYNKPELTGIYRANGTVNNGMVQSDLVSGDIVETKFTGYYLLFGVWDKSYIGVPTDSFFFYDLIAYLGTAYAENDIIGKNGGNNGIGGGIEGSLGLKYSYMFSNSSGITGRLGYRMMYNKMGTFDDKGDDNQGNEIWQETTTIDTWHGPFLDLVFVF